MRINDTSIVQLYGAIIGELKCRGHSYKTKAAVFLKIIALNSLILTTAM